MNAKWYGHTGVKRFAAFVCALLVGLAVSRWMTGLVPFPDVLLPLFAGGYLIGWVAQTLVDWSDR